MEIPSSSQTVAPGRSFHLPLFVQGKKADAEQGLFQKAETLNELLREVPDIRPEVVSYGKTLVADKNYPPAETIQRLGRLFAMHLDHTGS